MTDIVNPNQYAFDVACNQLMRQQKVTQAALYGVFFSWKHIVRPEWMSGSLWLNLCEACKHHIMWDRACYLGFVGEALGLSTTTLDRLARKYGRV